MTQAKEEYENLELKLRYFAAMTDAYGKRGPLNANMNLRLANIARSVSVNIRCSQILMDLGRLLEEITTCVEAKLETLFLADSWVSNMDTVDNEPKLLFEMLSARIEAFIVS